MVDWERAGVDEAASRGDVGGGSTTSVVLVTELIRLTLKKLQTALEQNRIGEDDLVAMATAVDPRALSRHAAAAAAACLQASPPSTPTRRRTPDDMQSSTDRLMTGHDDDDRPDTVSSREIAHLARKVLSDVMFTLSDHCY